MKTVPRVPFPRDNGVLRTVRGSARTCLEFYASGSSALAHSLSFTVEATPPALFRLRLTSASP